jgi:hypothetical protein
VIRAAPPFDFDTPESRGERVQALVFEITAVGLAMLALWGWVGPISRTPVIVAPLGVARYLDLSFMLDARWASLNALLACACFVLGLSHRVRFAHLVGLALFHVAYVARFCIGKTDHRSNLIGLSLLSLGLAAALFPDPKLRRRAALGFTLLLFGTAYTSAAIHKLSASGLLWVDGRHLWLWIAEKSVDTMSIYGATHFNFVQRAVLGSRGLGTVMLSAGLGTELFAWMMWMKRPRRWVLFGLVLMHLGIDLSMNISFAANQLLLLMLALPIAETTERYLATKRSDLDPGSSQTRRSAGAGSSRAACRAGRYRG